MGSSHCLSILGKVHWGRWRRVMGNLSRYLYQHSKWTDPDLHRRLDITRNWASHKIKSLQGRGVHRYPFVGSRMSPPWSRSSRLCCAFSLSCLLLKLLVTVAWRRGYWEIRGLMRLARLVETREFFEELVVVRFAPE